MLKYFTKLIKALSSNSDPGSIAHAFALGMLLGFMPKNNILWYFIFIFVFFMRIQRATLTLSTIIGSLLACLLDPLFDFIGYWILTLSFAQNFYLKLLDIPFVSFTKFNNTIVMGSFAFALIAYVPFYWLARLFIFLWRKYIANFVRKLKLVKMMKQIPFIKKIALLVQDI